MKLSVIIVNRNKRHLLNLALSSLMQAAENFQHEIFVVDNASTDASVELVQNKFPNIKLIENKKEVSVSKAANEGLKLAKGEYVLIVKADTITHVDALVKSIAFMDAHPNAGGVNIRMIDGNGEFITRSKWAVPNEWASFLKFTGLHRQFPKSGLAERHDTSLVNEFETAEVDVLNTSFMLMRSSVLHKVGLFDERFLISAGNIDLSYRIRLAGYKNYYFSKTYIIHFADQNQAKQSFNNFAGYYGSMFIFGTKYLFKPVVPWFKLQPQFSRPASI